MELKLKQYMESLGVMPSNGKILVACSGGLDSSVLVHMLYKLNYKTALAHVNFGLRQDENSREIQKLNELAEKLNLELHIYEPKTLEYANENGLSIQMAARELRYSFFETLLQANEYAFLATAHQADDNLENFFIYTLRGNMNAAYGGIALKNKKLIRPLLPFSREEILNYAGIEKISWCEDSSNEKDDYLRNRVRHHILPGIKFYYPNVLQDYYALSQDFSNWLYHLHAQCQQFLEKHSTYDAGEITFIPYSMKKNKLFIPAMNYLFKTYGFSKQNISDIIQSKKIGAAFHSSKRSIFVERKGLKLQNPSVNQHPILQNIEFKDLPKTIRFGKFKIKIKILDAFEQINMDKGWFFDTKNMRFPIQVRSYAQGDRMTLFGLDGTKKVSDILIDNKVENLEKPLIPILSDENSIFGLIPYRRSKLFVVTDNTLSTLHVDWSKSE